MSGRLVATIALVALAACERGGESLAPIYDTVAVETRDIEVTVEAAGVIEPEATVELKSKASGEILAVHAETGDVVEAGTLLVEIEKRTHRNRLAEAEAALVAAQARRKIAETAMRRAERLFENGTLTQTDYEQTQLEFANAESLVVSSQVAVENARISLDETDVRAPITGTIIEKSVEPGMVIASPTQAASGGTVLMKMADLTAVRVRTLVDETDIGKIQPGMPARVTVAAYPNQPFAGEVLKIEPQAIVEQNVTMFAVLIRLQNPSGLLKPGMNAEVEIEIASRRGVPAVPAAALRAEEDIPLTAEMLKLDESALRAQLDASGAAPPGPGNVLTLNGRRIELPDGVDAERVRAILAKRRSGGELADDERALLRRVFESAGFAGGSGGFGGAWAGGAPFAGNGARAAGLGPDGARSVTEYQFEGNYWVVARRGGKPVPVRVKTGLTDLEWTEVVAGLEPGDEVLLLPSSSLYEQQARLREFISQRFGGSPFQQPQGGPPPGVIRFQGGPPGR
ncbi:MAG TPA: efflux RND transporter periplasmic adaptor subunit [Gammaproteobacteria bacterium]